MSLEDQQKNDPQEHRPVGILRRQEGHRLGQPGYFAFTPETAGFLAQAGLKWTCDVTYADLPPV